MMRITREEEHYIGRARPASALARQGRLPTRTAASPRSTCSSSPTTVPTISAGRLPVGRRHHLALLSADGDAVARRRRAHQHAAARRAARARRHAGQRADGAGSRQGGATSWASTRSRSARSTRRPARRRSVRPRRAASRQYVTSAFVQRGARQGRRDLQLGREEGAQRQAAVGTKVRGSGVAVSAYSGGSIGFDGLLDHQAGRPRAVPVGHRQPRHRTRSSTCTASPPTCSACRGRQCDVVWGNTSKNLPWTCVSGGSQTTHAMTRAAHAVGDRRQEEAAGDRGQDARRHARTPTRWPTSRVSGGGRSMTFAQAAKKAIELGGKYDGHEAPEDINAFTKTLGGGAGRSGADRGGARQLPARRRRRSPTSPASPKSKSTSRPGSTRSSTSRRSPTSAR